ncbi:hypothetical protein TNIN_255691 [Trichonephila inaurata madagascariensis]|uniref:Uncharacterized protein n=1 Tax=Trichonephila inaurata madagascariensis TaxID=2747483 RepID=A0A8X7CAX0_9ARAC|nr:hypothetical protein TNIN_255691 [Trichonephila inaurata madagascariensis]
MPCAFSTIRTDIDSCKFTVGINSYQHHHHPECDRYDEEFVKDVLSVIVEESTATEKQKAAELEDKQKTAVVAQQREREFELEKMKIQLEMQKLCIKTPANIKEHFLDIWADLNDPLELAEKLNAYDSLRPGVKSNPNQIFKMKEEFRKPFLIKKSQSVGGSHDNHFPGPSRTVPRFPSYETEGRIHIHSVTDVGLLESSSQSVVPARELMKWKQERTA